MNNMKRSSMGVFTITQRSGGWIVFEDGRRVGGVVQQPFASAKRHKPTLKMAGEAETMAQGDVALSAKARVIRDCDPELWAACAEIEDDFADCHSDAAREAAHRAAGTYGVIIRLAMAGLEAAGKICRTGELRKGQPVFVATVNRQ